MPERRSHLRVPLDSPNFIKLRISPSVSFTLILTDISNGGAQLTLPPNNASMPTMLGMHISMLGLPASVDKNGKGINGIVSWLSPERCGIQFSTPLQLDTLALEQAFLD